MSTEDLIPAYASSDPKLEIIADPSDPSCVTISLNEEDHTLGNTVRYMIMRNPAVEYCGYSIPHPSETKVNVRIQTLPTARANALRVFDGALDDIIKLCDHVLEAVKAGTEAQMEVER